jgi:hemolysin III
LERISLGRMQNPVRGFLHGTGAVVSLAGVVALITRSGQPRLLVASAIYGLTLVCMYSTSALYHSVNWRPVWKARFQRLDHAFIYALVAGTFTALVVGVGHGPWVVAGLIGIWILVLLGLVREVAQGPIRRISLPLQFVAGGLAVAPLVITLVEMETMVAILTVAGGAVYLCGVWLFANDRPRLAPRIFSHHEFWHVMVIIASLLHFIAVWSVVASA